MHSSPNSSVVSRRGPEVLDLSGLKPSERKAEPVDLDPLGIKAEHGEEGLTIFLKVNYKVVLLVVVLTDIFHTSLNEVVAHFFGL
uniref:Uncharacterized protein n=1 Tax=Leviviridae sp. TaxID=2027243 RepID=A0A514CZS2_9VIRU|nr:MAG: hypothetical protein H4BulkLitter22706_000002 [Leviviridae sp.]